MDDQNQNSKRGHYVSCFWTEDELENPSAIKYDGRIVELEDIPGDLRDIAEILGIKFALDLASICGGQNIYIIPLEAIYRPSRNREIMRRFNGHNYKELAAMYRMNERHIHKIIKRGMQIATGTHKDWTGPLT